MPFTLSNLFARTSSRKRSSIPSQSTPPPSRHSSSMIPQMFNFKSRSSSTTPSRCTSPSPSLSPSTLFTSQPPPQSQPQVKSQQEDAGLRTEATDLNRELSDAETWTKMLDMQMEYHCYNSARLEAAVEARMQGVSVDEIARPSRLCLDLLNDELRTTMESERSREGEIGS